MASLVRFPAFAALGTIFTLWHVVWRGRLPMLGLGWLGLISPTVPYLQIIPFSTWPMASERFMYQSTLGMVMMICGWLVPFGAKKGTAIGVALALPWAFATRHRVEEWRSDTSLWKKEDLSSLHYFNAVRQHVQDLTSEREFAAAFDMANAKVSKNAVIMKRGFIEVKRMEPSDEPNTKSGGAGGPPKRFCREAQNFWKELGRETDKIAVERDLAYSNFIRNIKTPINPDGRLERYCASS